MVLNVTKQNESLRKCMIADACHISTLDATMLTVSWPNIIIHPTRANNSFSSKDFRGRVMMGVRHLCWQIA
jgi:hypothetical protein